MHMLVGESLKGSKFSFMILANFSLDITVQDWYNLVYLMVMVFLSYGNNEIAGKTILSVF